MNAHCAGVRSQESGGADSVSVAPGRATWNETAAPQDGQPIVACGGILVANECLVSKVPFTGVIYFSAESREWLDWRSGMAVWSSTANEVIIHYWMPYPMAAPDARPAHLDNDFAGVDD